jgi:5-methylcytosine-specific restriction endonuclease McrA
VGIFCFQDSCIIIDMSKICTKCKTEKSLDSFGANGPLYKKPYCRPCESTISKEWMLANPAASKATAEKHRKSHPEAQAIRDKKYYEKNRAEVLKRKKQLRIDDPEKHAEQSRRRGHRRRARLLGNGASFYKEAEVLELYGTVCHLCSLEIDMNAQRRVGKPGWENGLHIDHLVPIANGGADSLDNVRPSHGLCNIKKGHSTQF